MVKHQNTSEVTKGATKDKAVHAAGVNAYEMYVYDEFPKSRMPDPAAMITADYFRQIEG